MDKRTLFNVCLQISGKTAVSFAEEAGFSETFLHLYLGDKRHSARLEMLVNQFIGAHLPHLRNVIDEAEEAFNLAA